LGLFCALRLVLSVFTPLELWMKYLAVLLVCAALQGCTVLAIADVAASTVVYGVKTVVNVVDAVTPDIVNKKKKD
jgi:hypothetical protein